MIKARKKVPQVTSKGKARGDHVKERINYYATLDADVDMELNGNWPNFYFSQGHNGEFSLNLPQVFCVLRQVKEVRQLLKSTMNNAKDDVVSQATSHLPPEPTETECRNADNVKNVDIEFDWDVPFKYKN